MKDTIQMKQSFLTSAIADISASIQLTDTKVSIIVGATVAILVGVAACYQPISDIVKSIRICSCEGKILLILFFVGLFCTAVTFLFGIITISAHSCEVKYKSKWYLKDSMEKYQFEEYMLDVSRMKEKDIILNMTAELYKLNDINRHKINTFKVTLIAFSVLLAVLIIVSCIFINTLLKGV